VFKFRSEGWWLESHSFYGYRSGRDCCSTHSLSFHYIGWELTRALEILLYGLNPIFKRLNLEVPDAYPKRAPIYIQVLKLFFEEQGGCCVYVCFLSLISYRLLLNQVGNWKKIHQH